MHVIQTIFDMNLLILETTRFNWHLLVFIGRLLNFILLLLITDYVVNRVYLVYADLLLVD